MWGDFFFTAVLYTLSITDIFGFIAGRLVLRSHIRAQWLLRACFHFPLEMFLSKAAVLSRVRR